MINQKLTLHYLSTIYPKKILIHSFFSELKSNGHNHHNLQMQSSPFSSPNPTPIGGKIHINSNKSIQTFARAQFPPSILVKFKVAVSRRNCHKNVVFCKRNRFCVRNSSNREEEAQISDEKGARDNDGGGPSTSLLSFLCPLLKLFAVSNYDSIDWNC